jgi:nitrite reductase/ring-hydroxylating ferredoxin subunit
MAEWITGGRDDEVAEGEMQVWSDGERVIGIARWEGQVYAFDDTCTHEECSLTEGTLDGDQVVCQCHGSVFDITTGQVLLPPATEPLRVYAVRVDGGEIRIRLGEGDTEGIEPS